MPIVVAKAHGPTAPRPPSSSRRGVVIGVAAAIFVAVVAAGIAAAVLTGCASTHPPAGEEGAAADALARRMIAAVGGDAWDRTGAIAFTFRGKRAHLWDKARGFDRVAEGDDVVVVDGTTKRGVATRAGAVVGGAEGAALVEKAWRQFMNDTFWANPVVKAFDDGATRARVVLDDGREALLVTFTRGGATPGDRYLFVLGDDGAPTAIRMWVSVLPPGVEFAFADWITLPTGARVAKRHPGAAFDVTIDPIDGRATLAELQPGPDPFAALLPTTP